MKWINKFYFSKQKKMICLHVDKTKKKQHRKRKRKKNSYMQIGRALGARTICEHTHTRTHFR